MYNKQIKISVYNFDLSTKKDLLKEMVTKEVICSDKLLNEVITSYSKELELQGIETFSIDRNIIATENGYKIALYSEEENNN